MAQVLIIDDDADILLRYKASLRAAGHDVSTACLGEDGVAAARRDHFDIVLCDQRLRDQSGMEVAGLIHESCPECAIVLMAPWVTPQLVVEAKRAGATTFAAKPVTSEDLAAVINDALHLYAANDATDPNPVGYAGVRWADLVVRGVVLRDDPRTVLLWCRGVAVARSTLQRRCEAIHVTPKTSLSLVRLLRVVTSHAGEPWELQSWLDIADERTTRALMSRAGMTSGSPHVPDVESFLSDQKLVVDSKLINTLRLRLAVVLPIGRRSTHSENTGRAHVGGTDGVARARPQRSSRNERS